MKFTPLVSAIILSLQFTNSLAAGFICQPITGTLDMLLEEVACSVYTAKKDYFPSLTFLTPEQSTLPVCYSAKFSGKLGSIPITGAAYSGLTSNGMNVNDPLVSPVLTVASIITINGPSGSVYTHDLIKEPFDVGITRERLTIVAGSKTFKGAQGHMEISGNALAGPTKFAGTLCIPK
jgi:formate hydrogenlyase subunit 3/multisubunit Na+/H+ antiporter MnhD subunit